MYSEELFERVYNLLKPVFQNSIEFRCSSLVKRVDYDNIGNHFACF